MTALSIIRPCEQLNDTPCVVHQHNNFFKISYKKIDADFFCFMIQCIQNNYGNACKHFVSAKDSKKLNIKSH